VWKSFDFAMAVSCSSCKIYVCRDHARICRARDGNYADLREMSTEKDYERVHCTMLSTQSRSPTRVSLQSWRLSSFTYQVFISTHNTHVFRSPFYPRFLCNTLPVGVFSCFSCSVHTVESSVRLFLEHIMVQHICEVVAEYKKKKKKNLRREVVRPKVIIWTYDAAGRSLTLLVMYVASLPMPRDGPAVVFALTRQIIFRLEKF